MNRESVRLTRSSRSLDTRPLKAFIITSICSFIAYIFATTRGGVASMRDGRLTFCRSNLLRALLPSGPFWVPCKVFLHFLSADECYGSWWMQKRPSANVVATIRQLVSYCEYLQFSTISAYMLCGYVRKWSVFGILFPGLIIPWQFLHRASKNCWLVFCRSRRILDSISPKAGNLLQEFLSTQDNNAPLLPLLQFPNGNLLLQISLKLTLMQWCSSLLTRWALG